MDHWRRHRKTNPYSLSCPGRAFSQARRTLSTHTTLTKGGSFRSMSTLKKKNVGTSFFVCVRFGRHLRHQCVQTRGQRAITVTKLEYTQRVWVCIPTRPPEGATTAFPLLEASVSVFVTHWSCAIIITKARLITPTKFLGRSRASEEYKSNATRSVFRSTILPPSHPPPPVV
jgi:hypothetical protein